MDMMLEPMSIVDWIQVKKSTTPLSVVISWDLNELIWMRYIGRKDKKGVEIYEGDLIRISNGCIHKVIWSDRHCQFVSTSLKKKHRVREIFPDHSIVVGNIYENPEFLK